MLGNLRYAVRQLKKSPGFTIMAVMTLALGIGASTAIFTLFDQALLRSLPVKNPQELVLLRSSGDNVGHVHEQGGDHDGAHPYFSYPMYRDLRDKTSVFDGLIATAASSAGVSWHNSAEAVPVEIVSGNYFDVLGVRPAVGRLFASSDETTPGANPVVVLSFDYWKRRFNEDPTIVGQAVALNGTPFTVLGVAAPGFESVVWGDRPRVFMPMTMEKSIAPMDDLTDRRLIWLKIIGRLPAGRSTKQAEAGLNPVWTSLRDMEFKNLHDQSARAREKFVTTSHMTVADAAKGFSPMRESVEVPLKILMGMVLLVVAMAAVNMASLLLVRAAGRVREFSMRYALGRNHAGCCTAVADRRVVAWSGRSGVWPFDCAADGARADCVVDLDDAGYAFFGKPQSGHSVFCADYNIAGQRGVQSCAGSSISEAQPRRVAQTADWHGHDSVAAIPQKLRGSADWLQPVAAGGRGALHAHDSEPACGECRICDGSFTEVRSLSGDGRAIRVILWRLSSCGCSMRSLHCRGCAAWLLPMILSWRAMRLTAAWTSLGTPRSRMKRWRPRCRG